MGRQVLPLEQQEWFINQQMNNPTWSEAIEESIKTTNFWHDFCMVEDTLRDTPAKIKEVAIVPMTTWDCSKSVQYLKDNGSIPDNTRIVAHNFADVKHPGGYFMRRRGGVQEESLCSTSGLYPVLHAFDNMFSDCYASVKNVQHKYLNSKFAPVIYSRDIPTCWNMGSVNKFFMCDYVTSAMMTLRHAERATDYEMQLMKRVNTVFSSVLLNAQDTPTYFITGAWGCGAFRNNPKEVYSEYKKAIETAKSENGNVTVILAIPGGRNLDEARLAFNN